MKTPDELSDADVLTLAQERIRDPRNWTICARARDKDDRWVADVNAPDAVKWCAAGAIAHVLLNRDGLDDRFRRVWAHLRAYPPVVKYCRGEAAHYNNMHSHADVMVMFDWARERAARAVTA